MPSWIAEVNRRFGDAILALGLVALMIAQLWSLDVSRFDKLVAER